jgi:hypothetical protein
MRFKLSKKSLLYSAEALARKMGSIIPISNFSHNTLEYPYILTSVFNPLADRSHIIHGYMFSSRQCDDRVTVPVKGERDPSFSNGSKMSGKRFREMQVFLDQHPRRLLEWPCPGSPYFIWST